MFRAIFLVLLGFVCYEVEGLPLILGVVQRVCREADIGVSGYLSCSVGVF